MRLTSITEQPSGPFESYQLQFVTVDGRAMPELLAVRHPRHGLVTFLVTTAGATGVAVVNRRRS